MKLAELIGILKEFTELADENNTLVTVSHDGEITLIKSVHLKILKRNPDEVRHAVIMLDYDLPVFDE